MWQTKDYREAAPADVKTYPAGGEVGDAVIGAYPYHMQVHAPFGGVSPLRMH